MNKDKQKEDGEKEKMPKVYVSLILILCLGFVLRLIAAINLSPVLDDFYYALRGIGFLSADRLIINDQSSGLWFAFTSVMYNLFGVSQLTSRLASLIFGSLSILIIFLLTKEFFDEKTALWSAFLLAIAPFHIKWTVSELDVMAMFFSLLGMFLFVNALKSRKNAFFVMSGAAIGLAIYTKVYPLLFIPSLLIYFIYFNKKNREPIFTKKNIKFALVFLVTIFIFIIPTLTYNYLLYKDKGFGDLQFSTIFGLGEEEIKEFYGPNFYFYPDHSWAGLFFGDKSLVGSGSPLLWVAINFIRVGDPINFYLALLGFILIFIRRKKYADYGIFFILSIAIILPFMASVILLSKHYIFLELLIIPSSGLAIYEINKKISEKLKRNVTKYTIILLLILSLIFLGLHGRATNTHFYGKSYVAQMIDFKKESIPNDALIIGDGRLIGGKIDWAFYGRPHLSALTFAKLNAAQEQLPGKITTIGVYFFECAPDECGLDIVKNLTEFNIVMEDLTAWFTENGEIVKTIKEPDRNKNYYPLVSRDNKQVFINVHKARVLLKDSMLQIKTSENLFLPYDVGYEPKEKQFDYYRTHTALDSLVDKLAHLIVWLSVILSFLSIVLCFRLIREK